MDSRGDDPDRLLDDEMARLTATRAWPWQQPGRVASGLDNHGLVRHYLATGVGFEDLGPAEG
ncbi:MAG: hypothetical protein AB7I24_15930 [Candidatus Nanopelagicales bacterium]